MDLNIRVIQHKEFLKTTPTGQIDLQKSEQVLLRLAALNRPPNNRDVLLDLRDTTTGLTILDITDLVELMILHRDSFRNKLAIITETGTPHQLAGFLETYAVNRGFQVAAFDNFEAGILWLGTIIDIPSQDE